MTTLKPRPIPAVTEFTNPTEVLSAYIDDAPDGQDRRHMVIYWLAGEIEPPTVRGVVQFTTPEALVAREHRDGRTVRFI